MAKPSEKKTTPTEKATCKLCPVFDGSGYCLTKNKSCDENSLVCSNYGKLIKPKAKEKEEKPKTPQHIIDKANEILDKGDPVKFIFDTHQTLHIKDEILTLARIVAVGNQSAINTKGIQPSTDGQSGKGKSDGDKKFVHLMPPEYVLSGSISDKVLYYKKDLMPGTYIYSDDVTLSDDLISTIKRASSNFQGYTPHHTLDRDRNVIENMIPPRIVWGLNAVDNVSSLQLINRQFGVSVDESAEQDDRVLEYQKICGTIALEELPMNDDVLICREIIRDIKKHLFKVAIPYNYLIEWNDRNNRRNFDMFEDMIRGFAVYYYRQRECHDDILFANLDDFDNAIKLYTKRTEQQGRKLTDAELKLIKAISESGEADSKLLQEMTGLTQGRISQLIKGKGKDSDSGLIHKVKGLHYEKRTESTENGNVTKGFYSISGFDEKQYKDPIVWIDETARKEWVIYYHDITRLLLKKIKDGSLLITYITNINNIHSNVLYQNMLKLVLLGKISKIGNNGNNQTPDSESSEVISGNKQGNITLKNEKQGINVTSDVTFIVVEYIKNNYKHMQKPDSERDLEYRIIQATNELKTKFGLHQDVAYAYFVDYCKARSWR